MDIQKMLDAMSNAMRGQRVKYHLSLGALIEKLGAENPYYDIAYDFGGAPGEAHSYRGYYEDLSLEPTSEPRKVGQVLNECKSALHATFTGYKGGDYEMREDTPLWAAPYGSCGRAIVGMKVRREKVILETKEIGD